MKRLSYWAEAYVSPLFLLLITITVLMIGASDVFAYDDYAGGCDNCHGGFTEGSYTSLVDGGEWTGGLHNVHRNGMLGGDCDTCHTGNSFDPVFLESSNGGSGLSPISCVGCHGRDEDDGNATTTGTSQRGAGLRQHHVGHASCAGCHDDQTGYTPVGEDILPNYYAFPGTGHPSMPTDSCNPNGSEGVFGGTLLGLDNDGNDTYDTADPACAPVGCQSDAECDNGAFCDSVEICDLASGVCQAGTPVNVDDGVSCTDDSCDEANNTIVNAPNDGLCDNGMFCDGSETCDVVSDCQPGTPVNVDDGVGCTDDSCDEANNTVVNAPNDGLCDNGAFCDGSETCDTINDCQAGTPPCDPATETCDEVGDVCELIGCQSDAECDNGAFCDGVETCDFASGVCQAGTPVNVDDGVGCTDDSCDEANNTIVNAPNDGLCDNGMFCDGSETCDVVSDCQPGTPVNVDDGVGCTDDSCDEANNTIVNAPNDGLCDNGAFCDGSETCDTINDCQAGTPPCDPATETCDEVGDVCELIGCQSDAECDNGAFCDGVETCDLASGVCQAGTPVNVDDGVSCTDDDCDEANNTVVNAPNDGLCDNGMFCDGSETCDVVSDCQPGTPPCDSETETCDEVGDICELIPTPDVLDLDLASLQVTKRVRLARVKPVALKLVVNNNGTVEGTAIATITGEQNSVTVYFETLTVTDGVGKGRTTYSDKSVPPVPSFVPYTEGDILWKVTIDDDDVDLDEITAVTKVTQ